MTDEFASPLPGCAAKPKLLGLRLSVMMFLQYALWGMWLPIMSRYFGAKVADGGLGFTDGQIGWLYSVPAAIGAVVAPFIAGQVADRYFSTERVMAVLLAIGGVLWCLTAYQTRYPVWLLLLAASSVACVPTMALSNSLAFAHMSDPRSQFPRIRVWGTIGWIATGWAFGMVWLQRDLSFQWLPPFLKGPQVPDATRRLVDSLKAAGILSFGYAIYCLFLPHTPPKREAREPLAFRKAFKLFRWRSFAVLMIAGLLIAAVHNIYFMHTGKFLSTLGLRDADILPAMSIGQFAEIVFMALLGLLLKRLGFRRVLAIGATAYVVRYAIFGTTGLPVGVIVASQALHGVCFACYYAAAFIYVERLADQDVRHSAQTVVGILLGVGPLIGAGVNAVLARQFTPPGGTLNYSPYWYTVAAISLVVALALGVLFRDEIPKAKAHESHAVDARSTPPRSQ